MYGLTGNRDLYHKNGEAVAEAVEAAKNKAIERGEGLEAPLQVLYLRASSNSVKVKNSENSVLGEMLKDLACVNIADSDLTLLENLSMESVLKANPDKIFIVMQGSDSDKINETLEKTVLSNPVWQELTAVKNGEVHYMDQSLYNLKPNARWGEAYLALSDLLYGE